MRPGHAVRLAGLSDPAFEAELAGRGARLGAGAPLDLVFLLVGAPDDLARLTEFRKLLDPAGAIWVLRAKGNSRAVSETEIIDAAKRQGLVDNKVASFSEALSAMRLVIPLAERRPSGGE